MDFGTALNKVINGKCLKRASWSNGIYICNMPNTIYISQIYPNNPFNPCIQYLCSVNDINATDWELLS